jgi:hypothetical protein
MPKRGSKANLPPRVPAARKLPKLGKFEEKTLPDGTKRRVWKHQDFATPDVVKALKAGGWNPPVSKHVDAAEETVEACELPGEPGRRVLVRQDDFDETIALHDLSKDIHHVVAAYISDARYQQSPKEFRPGVKSFHKALKAAVEKFPSAESEHAEALNLELENLDHLALKKLGLEDDAPDVDLCRRYFLALLDVNGSVVADEAGRGADADRAKHLLIAGLAKIYEERTGRRPARGFSAYADKKPHETGPFFRFVTAVNELLPVALRLLDIDSLIRAHLAQ